MGVSHDLFFYFTDSHTLHVIKEKMEEGNMCAIHQTASLMVLPAVQIT